MIAAREAFGPTLKAERERRGISLQAIADSTKISIAHLAALERSDLTRWPKGIFRRAFLREYAAAIGLPPEPVVTEFVRLFPEDPSCTADAGATGNLRLTLVSDPAAAWMAAARRSLAALGEFAGVLLVGAGAASVLTVDPFAASAVTGLIYYPLVAAYRCRGRRLIRPLRARALSAWSWADCLTRADRLRRLTWSALSIPCRPAPSRHETVSGPELRPT